MDEKKVNWHRLSGADAVTQLKTNASCGLTRKEARSRFRREGANTLFVEGKGNNGELFRYALRDPVWLLLLVMGVFAICFSEPALGILSILPTVAWLAFSARCAYIHRKQRQRLVFSKIPTVRVLRDGKILSLTAQSVVRGDILLLRAGDLVPADCRLLSSKALFVRFSYLLTGEEKPTVSEEKKTAERIYQYGETVYAPHFENMLYGGSEILAGEASAVVTEIGAYSFLGAMKREQSATKVDEKEPKILSELYPFLRLIGFLALCLMLPLGIAGLFFAPSEFSAWRVFLPICAFTATASVGVSYLLYDLLLRQGIKQCIAQTKNQSLPYTAKCVDQLPRVTDLVILGHAATSDGKQHFDSAYQENTVFTSRSENTEALKPLCEAFLLLAQAEERLPALEQTSWSGHQPYLSELAHACAFDFSALEVRLVRADLKPCEDGDRILDVETKEGSFRLRFCYGNPTNVLASCIGIERSNGALRPILPEIKNGLLRFYKDAMSRACATVCVVRERGNQRSFMGCLSYGEEYQSHISEVLKEFEKRGVRVRIFLNSEEAREQAYAIACGCGTEVLCASQGNPLTVETENSVFCAGYSRKEIFSYIRNLRNRGRCVAVVGNSAGERGVLAAASLRIACVETLPSLRGSFGGFEGGALQGKAEGLHAAEAIRREADLLLPTVTKDGGGLRSLLCATDRIKETHRSLYSLLEALLGLQIFRAVFFSLSVFGGIGPIHPMLFLLTAFLPDLFAWTMIQRKKFLKKGIEKQERENAWHGLLKRKLWLPPLLAAVFGALLLIILSLTGAFSIQTVLILQPILSIAMQGVLLLFFRSAK